MERGGCGFVPGRPIVSGETPAGVAQHRLLPLGDPDLLEHVSRIEWENVILCGQYVAQPGRHSLNLTLKGYFYTNLVGTLFHTTSDFSRDANDYVSKIGSKIVLIDGSKLAEVTVEFGVGVATDVTYTVKRIDNDFFETI